MDDLNAASATPAAPPPQRTPGVIPEGTPADPATVAAITTTIREFVACLNAGELLRAYGLYTDDYLRRLFWRQPPLSQTDYDAYATPMPAPPDERAAILAIRDARVLPDGSAGATVTIKYAVIPIPKAFFFTLVQNDDRWLIADILGEISFSVP